MTPRPHEWLTAGSTPDVWIVDRSRASETRSGLDGALADPIEVAIAGILGRIATETGRMGPK